MTDTQITGTFDDGDVQLSPWVAKGKFTSEKYERLIKEFGVEPITLDLLQRFEKVTGHKPHRMLRRGLFFAHRQLNEILDDIEQGKKIYLYTGRGPTTESLHLGHILPIEFTAWLQKVFNAVVIFQMSDDEKYWFKDMSFEEIYQLGRKNARDIIAMGFDPTKTFIFSNRDFSREPDYQKIACDIFKLVRIKDITAIFGIQDTAPLGQLIWPAYQAVPAFSAAFSDIFKNEKVRCLVAYAIDQDPYFRYARDFAEKCGFYKPTAIMCQFLPALEGDAKMSSTGDGPSRTIFMDDSDKNISDKIKKYAFSGGKDTIELHRQYGGDPNVDISYQWLKYFMEDDDELLRIEKEYKSGKLLSGELKNITIEVITNLIQKHKDAKSKVTDEIVESFYDISNVTY